MLKPPAKWPEGTDVHARQPVRVDCVSGAAMIGRTEAVRQVGGFDPKFFLYHEEMDLCTRLRQAGWEIWSVPTAHVIHFDARASGYQQNRLPGQPLLGWRIGGMDRLWWKHKSLFQHRLWRLQGKLLLRLRIATLGLPALFSTAKRHRVGELNQVVKMLGIKVEDREQVAEADGSLVSQWQSRG